MTKLNIKKGHFISLAVLVVVAIVIVALKPGKSDFRLSASETLEQTVKRSHLISYERYTKLIAAGTQGVQLIDLRSSADYESGHLPDAINIPMEELCDNQSMKLFTREGIIKVMYSDSSYQAAQAWCILYQMGCPDLVILDTTGALGDLIQKGSEADAPMIYNDERKQFTFVPDSTVSSEITPDQ